MHIGLTVINAALMICSKLPWVGPLFKVLKKLGSFLSKSVAKCNKGLKKLVKKTKPLQKAMDKTQAVMDTADTYLAPPANMLPVIGAFTQASLKCSISVASGGGKSLVTGPLKGMSKEMIALQVGPANVAAKITCGYATEMNKALSKILVVMTRTETTLRALLNSVKNVMNAANRAVDKGHKVVMSVFSKLKPIKVIGALVQKDVCFPWFPIGVPDCRAGYTTTHILGLKNCWKCQNPKEKYDGFDTCMYWHWYGKKCCVHWFKLVGGGTCSPPCSPPRSPPR